MKNKKSIIGVLLFCLATLTVHIGYAQEKETRSLADFSEVSFEGAYEILLKEGEETKIELESTKKISTQEIATIVSNGKLRVKLKDEENKDWKNTKVRIVLYYKQLNNIENSGVLNLKTEKVLKTDKLSISISGVGNMDLELDVQKLNIDMSGAMNITLKGTATTQDFQLSGAGSVVAFDLIGEKVNVDMSGAGSAKVHATKSLSAAISGVGSVRYRGNPEKVSADSGMLGKIKPE
jgi:hypothetical protein